MSWMGIILTFSIVNNVVLGRLLGICPCVSAPRDRTEILWVGVSMTAVMSMAALAAWALQSQILGPLGIGYLRTPTFVLAVAGLTLLLQRMALWVAPSAVRGGGFPLTGIGINCATIGVALIVSHGSYTAGESLVAGIAAGGGFLLVLVILGAIRERLDAEKVPRALEGLPIHLISAGLLAWAFLAFDRAFLIRILGR